jgi:hypothetical protein
MYRWVGRDRWSQWLCCLRPVLQARAPNAIPCQPPKKSILAVVLVGQDDTSNSSTKKIGPNFAYILKKSSPNANVSLSPLSSLDIIS